MAIEKELFDLIYSLKNNIKVKNIVSLGNPYFSQVNLDKYFKVDSFIIKSIPIKRIIKPVLNPKLLKINILRIL